MFSVLLEIWWPEDTNRSHTKNMWAGDLELKKVFLYLKKKKCTKKIKIQHTGTQETCADSSTKIKSPFLTPFDTFFLHFMKLVSFTFGSFWPCLTFSKHLPSGKFFVCVFVGVSVCPCVCSLLGYRLPPLTEVGSLIYLEQQNILGKVVERSGLRFEYFCLEVV